MPDIKELQEECARISEENGWWDEPRETGTMIALMHSELSEGLEAVREGNIHGKDGLAEELADTVIRILDFCEHNDIDLEEEVLEKMSHNANREYRHGGKNF